MRTPTVRTTVDLDRDLYIAFKEVAMMQGMTLKEAFNEALRALFRKRRSSAERKRRAVWKKLHEK